jgi:Reverse transcriptase (RNA-dependent DNA polymerase)
METIQLLISQATQFEWPVHQMDVKLAFLNGVLEEKVYVEQPLGYMKPRKKHKLLRLKKDTIQAEANPESMEHENKDDLIFVGNSQRLIDEFKKVMNLEFEMTDLGMMSYFLDLEIKQDKSEIFISQGAYARDIS